MKNKKKKQENFAKKQSGITLIALVITIIVLLILAGVTITMLLGEDGIIAQAKLAAEKTKEAEDKQEQDLKDLAAQIENSVGGSSSSSGGETPPVRKPPETQTYTLTEGASQSSTMKKYVGTDNGTVNPILKSYDSALVDIIGQCIVGHNSWKQHLESVGYTVAPNHNMLYSIEFTTNAKEFMFTAVGSLRVSVDEKDGKGYLYTNEEGEVDIEGDNSYLHATGYDASKFRFIKVSFEDSKERNIKIELMGAFANLYADAQYYVKTIEKEKPKTMMFVGDSWTTGQSTNGAQLPYRSYPTIIANNLGMTAINLGVAGTGYTKMSGNDLTYYQERMQYSKEYCRTEPDYIFICGGGNDVTDVKYYSSGQKTLDDVAKAADDCYKYAKTAFPNAKVIVLGLEYVKGGERYEASSELKQLNELLKTKAKDNQIPYIDFVNGDAIDGSGNKVHENDNFVSDPSDLSDSIHLTYEGYKKMANKLTPVIEKLIK